MSDAIVVDIEGTTSSGSHVHTQLFPYSRRRVPEWIRRPDPGVAAIVEEVRAVAGRPGASLSEVAAILRGWIDADVKAAPLKTLQGLIWEAGFTSGELTSHLYPDVPHALRDWHAHGRRLYVYSSGSVLAQRLWFRHTPYGDLSQCLSGYFDIRNAGPKREAASYAAITAAIGVPGPRTLFLSDTPDELDAARRAGWRTAQVLRPEEGAPPASGHVQVTGFHEVAEAAAW
ncbi:acireductone synthase [Microbispora sp. H10949]|uniref:acireductone synthase n=1 Tax=Microbispora sp. H10949 TaxID=2729111 RepID=UPI0015FFE84B|nr:acireductone synthase [Microbispora sp. H10949]